MLIAGLLWGFLFGGIVGFCAGTIYTCVAQPIHGDEP